MKINENIAEPYRHWTVDTDAKKTPLLILRNVLVGISACAFISLLFIAKYYGAKGFCFPSILALSIIAIIFVQIIESKLSSSVIKCSQCKQNMKDVQYNYPGDPCKGLLSFSKIAHGTNGRIYVQQLNHTTPAWYQVMQELRICPQCRRYIVLFETKTIEVGNTWNEVQRREERLDNANKSLFGKNNKTKN